MAIFVATNTHGQHAKVAVEVVNDPEKDDNDDDDYYEYSDIDDDRYIWDIKNQTKEDNFEEIGLNDSSTEMKSYEGWPSLACNVSTNATTSPHLNILIFASYRSGSSFFGELLSQHPRILYMYEPYKLMDMISSGGNRTKRIGDINRNLTASLNGLFNCNIQPFLDYSVRAFQHVNPQAFFRALQKWLGRMLDDILFALDVPHEDILSGKFNFTDYKTMEMLQRVCGIFKYKAVKMIRGHYIQDAAKLLAVNDFTKILYLVRDPRGVMSSRTKVDQAKAKNVHAWFSVRRNHIITAAKHRCNLYTKNLLHLKAAISQSTNCSAYSSNVRLVRYEDVAYDTMAKSIRLYRFLGILFPPELKHWIRRNTVLRKNSKTDLNMAQHAYTTKRDSVKTAEAWRSHLPYDIVKEMDAVCAEALKELGYSRVGDEATYHNMSHSLVHDLAVPRAISLH